MRIRIKVSWWTIDVMMAFLAGMLTMMALVAVLAWR